MNKSLISWAIAALMLGSAGLAQAEGLPEGALTPKAQYAADSQAAQSRYKTDLKLCAEAADGFQLLDMVPDRPRLGREVHARGMPEPVPVLVMPRIAVDKAARVHQLGPSLFKDALDRAEAMSQHAGVKAFLVYALDDRARQFYLDHGFQPSVLDPTVLALRVPTLTA